MQAMQPITLTASTTLTRKQHAECQIDLSAAAGLTITLPASDGSGSSYKMFVRTTVTSNNYIIQVANATDVLQGGISISTALSSGRPVLTTTTTDTITMNGSTQGGIIGSWVTVVDTSSGFWELDGFLVSSGSETSPFSAAV